MAIAPFPPRQTSTPNLITRLLRSLLYRIIDNRYSDGEDSCNVIRQSKLLSLHARWCAWRSPRFLGEHAAELFSTKLLQYATRENSVVCYGVRARQQLCDAACTDEPNNRNLIISRDPYFFLTPLNQVPVLIHGSSNF